MTSTSYYRDAKYFNKELMKDFPEAKKFQKILEEIEDGVLRRATKWVEDNLENIKGRIESATNCGCDNTEIQVDPAQHGIHTFMAIIGLLKHLLYDLGYQVVECNSPPNDPQVIAIFWRKKQ